MSKHGLLDKLLLMRLSLAGWLLSLYMQSNGGEQRGIGRWRESRRAGSGRDRGTIFGCVSGEVVCLGRMIGNECGRYEHRSYGAGSLTLRTPRAKITFRPVSVV